METHKLIEEVSNHYNCTAHEISNKKDTSEKVMSCRSRIVKTLMMSGLNEKDISEILNISEQAILYYSIPHPTKPKAKKFRDPRLKHAAKLLKDGMDVVSAGFCAGYTKRKSGKLIGFKTDYRYGHGSNLLVEIVENAGGVDAFIEKHINNEE